MPGWHNAINQRPDARRLKTAGLVLEQHPDRSRLFMQWHEMGWPVMWDPFNLLEFPAVPVTYLLDSSRTVLVVQPRLDRIDDILGRLLHGSSVAREGEDSAPVRPIQSQRPEVTPAPIEDTDPTAWGDHATSVALWGGADRVDEAVEAARRVVEGSDDPVVWFRLGVVLRMRYDSARRQASDFTNAVEAWSRALNADPNQYVWRRRLQQYGPRLAKPYPFYDWVPKARTEIQARGEEPVGLVVEPHGAEYAEPATGWEPSGADVAGPEPDPQARVQADEGGLVEVETVLIPPALRPGDTVRVHLILTPDHGRDAHWNNEAGHSELWVSSPPDGQVDPNHQLLPVGAGDVSDETRHMEFEVAVPETAEATCNFSLYLLYYACEGAAGVCVYLRQDLEIPIPVATGDQAVGLAG